MFKQANAGTEKKIPNGPNNEFTTSIDKVSWVVHKNGWGKQSLGKVPKSYKSFVSDSPLNSCAIYVQKNVLYQAFSCTWWFIL